MVGLIELTIARFAISGEIYPFVTFGRLNFTLRSLACGESLHKRTARLSTTRLHDLTHDRDHSELGRTRQGAEPAADGTRAWARQRR